MAALVDAVAELVRSATHLQLSGRRHFSANGKCRPASGISVERNKIPLASSRSRGFKFSQQKTESAIVIGWSFCSRGSVMGALSHLRIVEIGSSAATSYCARLFADFGADVQKIEPPQGDPLRRAAPLTPGGHSAWFAFLSFNKSSIVLDKSDASAAARLHDLIAGCDILLDGRGLDAADCPDIDLSAISQDNPGLIHLDVSWFGDRGPYANFAATDCTIRALTGLIKLVGPEQGPPMHAPDFQTGILGGLWGFIAASSSVLGRMQDGRGRASHLSIFEASIAVTEYIMFEAFQRGDVMQRLGVNRFWPTFPVGIYQTKQGWLGVTTVTPAQWRAFCEMLGLFDLRDDAMLFLGVDRLQHVDDIESQFIPKL